MLGVVACERTPDENKNVNTVENIYFCNELANKVNLPIVVHSRKAHADTLDCLKKYPVNNTGVIHCYSGSEAHV